MPSSVFSVKVLVVPLYFSTSHFFSGWTAWDDMENVEEDVEESTEELVEGPVWENKV